MHDKMFPEKQPISFYRKLESMPSQNVREKSSRKVGDMWEVSRQLLQKFYQPYNEMLAKTLNDTAYEWLTWWTINLHVVNERMA